MIWRAQLVALVFLAPVGAVGAAGSSFAWSSLAARVVLGAAWRVNLRWPDRAIGSSRDQIDAAVRTRRGAITEAVHVGEDETGERASFRTALLEDASPATGIVLAETIDRERPEPARRLVRAATDAGFFEHVAVFSLLAADC